MNKIAVITIGSIGMVLIGGTVAAQRAHHANKPYLMNQEEKEYLNHLFYQQQALQLSYENQRVRPGIDTAQLAFQYGSLLAPIKQKQDDLVAKNCANAGISNAADCDVNLFGEVKRRAPVPAPLIAPGGSPVPIPSKLTK